MLRNYRVTAVLKEQLDWIACGISAASLLTLCTPSVNRGTQEHATSISFERHRDFGSTPTPGSHPAELCHLAPHGNIWVTSPCHTFNSELHCLGENWFQLKVRDNLVSKNNLCWINHSQAKESVTHSTSGSASEPKCILPLLSSGKELQIPHYKKSLAPLCPYHKSCFGVLHTLQISAIINSSVSLPGFSGNAQRQQHWEMGKG